MSNVDSTPASEAGSAPWQFRLVHLLYVVSLAAAALAAFGPWGLLLSTVACLVWAYVLCSAAPLVALSRASLWLVGGLCSLGFLLPGMRMGVPREAFRRMHSMNNLKQIALAMHNYRDAYGSFPPAFIADENGTPMHSWRVLLLPFVDSQALYDRYDFAEPWDGPNNSQLLTQVPLAYEAISDDSQSQPTLTAYQAVVGPSTAWPGASPGSIEDFADGAGESVMLVGCPELAVPWMQPRDISLDKALQTLPTREGPYDGGRNVAFVDGSVTFVGNGVARETWAALFSVNDGVEWDAEDLKGKPVDRSAEQVATGVRVAVFFLLLVLPLYPVFRRK